MSLFSSIKSGLSTMALSVYNWAYRGAALDDSTIDFRPQTSHPDFEVLQNWETLVSRARWLVKNAPLFSSVAQNYLDLILGHGIMSYSTARDDNEELMTDWNDQCDNVFELFAQHADITNICDWPQLSRIGLRSTIVDGIVFFVEHILPDRPFPLCYELVEVDQLDTSKDTIPDTNGNYITRGIEKNKYDQPVAYWMFTKHPTVAQYESERIPASRVLPLYGGLDPVRPKQSFGASWFAPIIISAWHLDKYWEEEMHAARIQSRILGMVKRESNPLSLSGSPTTRLTNALGQPVEQLPDGLFISGGIHDDIDMLTPTRLTNEATAWIQRHLFDIAAGANLSYSHLTKDYANRSFSSHQAEELRNKDAYIPVQNWYINAIERKVRARVISIALATGMISLTSGGIVRFLRNPARYVESNFVGKAFGYLNPGDEKGAEIDGLRSFTNTWTRIANARLGTTRNKLIREYADDWKQLTGESKIPREVLMATLGVPPNDGQQSNKTRKKTRSESSE